jgi:hypothetical protein
MKSSVSSKLTIILLSNKINETIASVSRYISFGVNIIVPSPSVKFYKAISSLYQDKKSVFCLRPSGNSNDMFVRLATANSFLSTPYFCIAAGDDMLLRVGLLGALKFLENNKSYANFFGGTSNVIFKAPFLPLITPRYTKCFQDASVLPECIKTFNQCEYYNLFYGVSRKCVLDTFISLFPLRNGSWEGKWKGIWEVNYAIAVSMHGSSFFGENLPFLLRLVHQPTRTSMDDFPEPPEGIQSIDEYVSRYINTDVLRQLMAGNGMRHFTNKYIGCIFSFIARHSACYDLYPNVRVENFSLLRVLTRSVFGNLIALKKRPSYFFDYFKFLGAAQYFYWQRTKNKISCVV